MRISGAEDIGLILGCAGGEGGIRTHDRLTPTSVFETDAFSHSATSPRAPAFWSGRG